VARALRSSGLAKVTVQSSCAPHAFTLSGEGGGATLATYLVFCDLICPGRSRTWAAAPIALSKVGTRQGFLFVSMKEVGGSSKRSWLLGVRVQPRLASLGNPTTRQLGSPAGWGPAARKPSSLATRRSVYSADPQIRESTTVLSLGFVWCTLSYHS